MSHGLIAGENIITESLENTMQKSIEVQKGLNMFEEYGNETLL